MKPLSKLDLPPIWMLFFILVAQLLAKWFPIFSFSAYFSRWIWMLPLIIGIGFIIWAEVEFLKHKTPVLPRKSPKTLLTTGPFKISRNPIYMGFAMIIFAVVLRTGAISSVISLLGFVWLITKRFIDLEEAQILTQFGDEAKQYFASTRRW